MASSCSAHQQQNYGIKPETLTTDYCQGYTNLDASTHPSLSSGNSPFLHGSPTDFNSNLDPEEQQQQQQQQQQVVVASNDLPVSDMDLANFLDMDDKTLSELTGVNSTEWNSLFNGQLDDMSSPDPMTGVQQQQQQQQQPPPPMLVSPSVQTGCMSANGQQQAPRIDRWLIEETQKLERQQKLQQRKLMELQQTLLKTEILKNQLQIASISSQSSSPTMSMSSSSLLLEGMGQIPASGSPGPQHGSPQQPQQQQQLQQQGAGMDSSLGANFDLSPNPAVGMGMGNMSPMFTGSPNSGNSATVSSMKMSGSTSSRGGRMSTSSTNSTNFFDLNPPELISAKNESPPVSPPSSDPNSPGEDEPCKRKVHNLIEKKYRSSINDRICLLRDMVSKHCKDNKKLQKSAVLQKTIDFIHHLQNTIKKLQDENQQLREALARATSKAQLHGAYFGPNTPSSGNESELDSGNPSSPEGEDGSPTSGNKMSIFSRFLRNPLPHGGASQYLMVVMLVAVLFVNPLALSGPGLVAERTSVHTASRMVLGDPTSEDLAREGSTTLGVVVYIGFWALRLLVAALCFGWITLKSMPRIMANSQDSVHFWRLRKQAEKDLEQGDFMGAKDNLETALSVINRPLPTSYFGMVSGLIWSFFSHLLFQLVVGRYAVHLASMFIWRKAEKDGAFRSPKKPVFGVTFDDVSTTYHLIHQINLASSNPAHLKGMGFFLALNALNFAEADRPFRRLTQLQVGEMYFALGLQCHHSIPYVAAVPMWYYFFCFRNVSPSKYATPLKWAMTGPGMSFLLSGKWASEVGVASRLYTGNAAMPAFSVTRAYCKELLCEAFNHLLLPNDSPDDGSTGGGARGDREVTLRGFKVVLNLAKEASACLLNDECNENKSIKGAAGCSDSGFTVIQWWASVGLVSCYWLSDEESAAEDYYHNIEALSREMGAAVPSALQLAFKAKRTSKQSAGQQQQQGGARVALDVLLQLCATTSNALEGSVANLLHDQSNSAETELHQLGLLQACDWLLSLKVSLWENHKNEDGFAEEIRPGFYQDLETLSKLVTLLPSARARVRLYKGCYQLIAGANPIEAHAMLNSTASASLLRRRAGSKDSLLDSPASCSHEHAMAQQLAFKHLPPAMETPQAPPPSSPTKRPLTPLPQKASV